MTHFADGCSNAPSLVHVYVASLLGAIRLQSILMTSVFFVMYTVFPILALTVLLNETEGGRVCLMRTGPFGLKVSLPEFATVGLWDALAVSPLS